MGQVNLTKAKFCHIYDCFRVYIFIKLQDLDFMDFLYSSEESQDFQFPVPQLAEILPINTSIGICAYNEEQNIGKLLERAL